MSLPPIFLTNTLGRTKEEFHPIHEGKVGIYSCGPTVYQPASIGNFRAFIFADTLRRVFEASGYEVTQVMNITDVGHLVGDGDEGEDKLEKSAKKEGRTAWEIASYYTDMFLADMDRLNIRRPTVMPRATAHIKEQIEMIETLEKNGFAYRTSDGVYFDTAKLPDYGKLSGQKLEEKEEGARVAVNDEKRNPSDFALWKISPAPTPSISPSGRGNTGRHMEWDSPWGVGFPGWHIECSAMSEKYLGSPFDIHTGGIDHIPVHHTNEIAQTEGARGHALANVWMHNEFLQVDGGKMSKSLGNTYTIDDLAARGFDPLAFRYFCFSGSYRTPLNFTWESLTAAATALANIEDIVRVWPEPSVPDTVSLDAFMERVRDDLDLPGALAVFWRVVRDESMDEAGKGATLLAMDAVLGLRLKDVVGVPLVIPQEVQDRLEKRSAARAAKDFSSSDALRDEIAELGYLVEDGASGQRVRKVR